MHTSQFQKIDPYDWFCAPGSHFIFRAPMLKSLHDIMHALMFCLWMFWLIIYCVCWCMYVTDWGETPSFKQIVHMDRSWAVRCHLFTDVVMVCSSCRWCTGTWSPATSSTWTIRETRTPFASVTSASPSSCEETTGCCWLPATRLTSWPPRWGSASASAHALRWQTLSCVSDVLQVLMRQGYDAACDIWSLGVLLYTMLAGSVWRLHSFSYWLRCIKQGWGGLRKRHHGWSWERCTSSRRHLQDSIRIIQLVFNIRH